MFFRIFIRDMKRKKGINFILFLFIWMAAVFVASSVNNILVVSNAMNYSMEQGKVPNQLILANEQEGGQHLDDWLDEKGSRYVKSYVKNELLSVSASNMVSFSGKSGDDFENKKSVLLQAQWNDTLLIFDEEEKVADLKDGEIGMQASEISFFGMKPGDTMTLRFGEWEKTFQVVEIRDPAFGGDYIESTRYLVSDGDFERIRKQSDQIVECYGIYSENLPAFVKAMSREDIRIILSCDRQMIASTYMTTMLIAGVLIIVGICLILIAFFVLRFTILFTLQEDYKEIGIMKAVGIREFTIKKIYLVKYLIMASAAAALGCIVSVPFSEILIQNVKGRMMLESGNAHIAWNLLCSAMVLFLSLFFCYLSTNRLKKFSAMDAIRCGQTGERFQRKSAFSLSRNRRGRVAFFLARNDIFSNLRRFIVLIITYALGTLLIILPVNITNTLESEEMIKNFLLDPEADFYIAPYNGEEQSGMVLKAGDVEKDIRTKEAQIKAAGYNAKINTSIIYMLPFYKENEGSQYACVQPIGSDGSYIAMAEGKCPLLENEVAMSEQVMKELGVSIGDTVYIKGKQGTKAMIVSGSYQNFIQLGKSIFLNQKFDLTKESASMSWYYQGKLKGENSPDAVEQIKQKIDGMPILDQKDVLKRQLGSTSNQIGIVKGIIIVLVCAVNVLITILMMRIFIMEERGQIAVLRSTGFSVNSVRFWQILRMAMVMVIGMLVAMAASVILNDLLLRPIFGMMGATHMKIVVAIGEAYILYPGLLFGVILAAAVFGSLSVRKISVIDVNQVD